MALDPYYDDLCWCIGREVACDRWNPHAEGGLVHVLHGIGDLEFSTSFSKTVSVLGRGVDRDGENFSSFDHLLGRQDTEQLCK